MKNLLSKKLLFIALISLTIASCDDEISVPKGQFTNGVFITNEGNWGSSNGSLSFYSYTTDSVFNDIFYAQNGRSLGDVVQSATTNGEYIYVVVNGSNKIEIAEKSNMKEYAAISDLDNPRILKIKNNTGYLSQWGEDGVIKVIDLNSNTITKTINVGTGPENMAFINNKLFVANSGAYYRDSTISIIDITTEEVIETLKVGDNPRDLVVDMNNKLWALCYGYVQYTAPYTETGSKLIRINPTTYEIEKTFEIGETLHPTCLEISKNGDYLYVGGGYGFNGIFKISINNESFASEPLVNRAFYAINVDVTTNNIFGFDAMDYATRGNMYRYDSNGNQLGIYEVGVIPNGTNSIKK